MNYVLQWRNTSEGTPWEYHFHVANDKLALEFAARTLVNSLECTHAREGFYLFAAGDEYNEARMVGQLQLAVTSHLVSDDRLL